MKIRGGGDFLNLRLQNFSPIGFCTYSWLRRLNFCFQLHNGVYYPILKEKIQSPPTRRRTAVSKLKSRRFSTFCLHFTLFLFKNIIKNCPGWFQEYSKQEFTGGRPPPPPPPITATAARRRTKIPKRWQICIVMGIDFGVIGAAGFINAIRFYVRRPTRRPPSHQNIKKTTDILLWVSILGIFGPLIAITPLDFMSADLPAG